MTKGVLHLEKHIFGIGEAFLVKPSAVIIIILIIYSFTYLFIFLQIGVVMNFCGKNAKRRTNQLTADMMFRDRTV